MALFIYRKVVKPKKEQRNREIIGTEMQAAPGGNYQQVSQLTPSNSNSGSNESPSSSPEGSPKRTSTYASVNEATAVGAKRSQYGQVNMGNEYDQPGSRFGQVPYEELPADAQRSGNYANTTLPQQQGTVQYGQLTSDAQRGVAGYSSLTRAEVQAAEEQQRQQQGGISVEPKF